jgi:pyruvate/2-oxoacid:ferredoxin oxidoreductase beta subunit/intein/homing endonuclease
MRTFKSLKDVPAHELTVGGGPLCAGCPADVGLKLALKALGRNTIVVNASGCMTLYITFPNMTTLVPWLHLAIENAAAGATGVAAALKQLHRKGITILCYAGDGATYDIGFQSLSGAAERGDDFVYVCLPPDEEIMLGNGELMKIGDFVDNCMVSAKTCGDIGCGNLLMKSGMEGKVLITNSIEKDVVSWDGLDFKPFKILAAQRINSPEYLVKIRTRSGSSLSLTPEHKVLVDSMDGFCWKRADEIKTGNYLIAPRKIDINNEESFKVIDMIGEDVRAILSLDKKQEIKQHLIAKYGSVRNACSKLGLVEHRFKKNSLHWTIGDIKRLHFHRIISDDEFFSINRFTVSRRNDIRLNAYDIDENISYLLGLICSDGYVGKKYRVVFINAEKKLLEIFRNSCKEIFCQGTITETKIDNTYSLAINNPVLWSICKTLDIKENPKTLAMMSENNICSFIRGVFDGDGCIGIGKIRKSSLPVITLTTISETLARRYKLFLQRVGIASALYKRNNAYDIHVSSRLDILKFIERIGSNHPKKLLRLESVAKELTLRKPKGKYFSLSPQASGSLLKKLYKQEKIRINSVDRNITSIAAGKWGASKEKIRRCTSVVNERSSSYDALDKLVRTNFFLDPVKETERIESKSKYVYDITVEGTHVFVPNGAFVISNCYNNQSFSNTGVQMSSATPYGTYTTTTPLGNPYRRKPMVKIMAAHGIAYAATACVSYALDFMNKVRKAAAIKGPAFIDLLAPCPTGWGFDASKTIEMGRLAVATGAWPLYEVESGKFRLTFAPEKLLPVEAYLSAQRRFQNLHKDDRERIQRHISREWSLLREGKLWETQEY